LDGISLGDGLWIWAYGGLWRIIEVEGNKARIVMQDEVDGHWIFNASQGWRPQYDWEIKQDDLFGLKATSYKPCTPEMFKRKLLETL